MKNTYNIEMDFLFDCKCASFVFCRLTEIELKQEALENEYQLS